jgi:putative MATE family efflux protein
MDYGQILFLGSVFILFSSVAYGILRAEGNVTKNTYAMLFGAVLNMVLDPIFIYVFNLGVRGAAISTIISLALVSLLLLYWFKKETYVKFSFKNFSYSNKLIKQILNVGLPAGTEFLIIGALSGTLNFILMLVGGVDAVAVYTVGWRVVLVAMTPVIAIGISIVAVTGANFGAKKFKNINLIFNQGIKLGFIIVIVMAVAIFLLAPYISYLFAYSPESAGIRGVLTDFLRVTSLFYLVLPIGISASSIFQGLGKGLHSLALSLIRVFFLEVFFSFLFAIVLGFGQYGAWWGLITGNAVGACISLIWAKLYLRKFNKVKTAL